MSKNDLIMLLSFIIFIFIPCALSKADFKLTLGMLLGSTYCTIAVFVVYGDMACKTL